MVDSELLYEWQFMNTLGFCQVYVTRIEHVMENSSFCTIYKSSVSPGFAKHILSYVANMSILMILYDFCLLPAQFCHIIVYIWKVESHVQIADRCAPWKISSGAETVLKALAFGIMPQYVSCIIIQVKAVTCWPKHLDTTKVWAHDVTWLEILSCSNTDTFLPKE
jgi:hypothetical protein